MACSRLGTTFHGSWFIPGWEQLSMVPDLFQAGNSTPWLLVYSRLGAALHGLFQTGNNIPWFLTYSRLGAALHGSCQVGSSSPWLLLCSKPISPPSAALFAVSPSPPVPALFQLHPGQSRAGSEPGLCPSIPPGTPWLLPSGTLAEQLQDSPPSPGGSTSQAGSDPEWKEPKRWG